MAVGWPTKTTYANGDVYSASDVNDTNGTLNLLGASVAYTAGKNKIINGDFRVWQRGTTFSNPAVGAYTADRFAQQYNGTGATRTISQQTFTPGTAPVSGYEGQFFYRYAVSAVGTGNTYAFFGQYIEDVRTCAGQTVTVSFWAKADASRTLTVDLEQNFGSGGSGAVYTSQVNNTVTTSWARYTATIAVPSISGKTIGTSSLLNLRILVPAATVLTVDVWGVQVEVGSTATAFQTASGTIQGELALCQRYYQTIPELLLGPSSSGGFSGNAYNFAIWPVVMRVAPTITFFAHDGTSGAVTLYDGTTPTKSTSVGGMTAYSWGYTGNFSNSSWVIVANQGLLAFKYNASAEF